MPDNRDQLDRLLDSALASYADAGPDSGLEHRILGRIAAAAHAAPRRRRLRWAIALPAAAGLLIFAVVSTTRRAHGPAPDSPQVRNSGQISPRTPGSIRANRTGPDGGSGELAAGPEGRIESGPFTARMNPCPFKATGCRASSDQSSPDTMMQSRRRTSASPAPPPKLDIFPTLHPLSPEEQALASFAAQAPKSERESLIAAEQQANAPIRIAAIEIRPLEPPASGAN